MALIRDNEVTLPRPLVVVVTAVRLKVEQNQLVADIA
jgi:hypothetical protein